jgi:hypothetical protein
MLYSFLQEFWLEAILMGIGNNMGQYVKLSKATKQRKYTSYARIYVYMDISKELPGSITLEYQDEDWNQTIDYEHIPFRCRKCHEHGHLFRDCPLNAQAPKAGENKQKDGFTTVTEWKRNPPRKKNPDNAPKINTKKSYDILNQLSKEDKIQDPCKEKIQEKGKGHAAHPSTQIKEYHQGDKLGETRDSLMQLDEQDLADIDLEKLEEALNWKDLQTNLVEQLRRVHKVFIDSTVGSIAWLGIATDPSTDSKHAPQENKRWGHKSTHQLIKEVGNFMLNSC